MAYTMISGTGHFGSNFPQLSAPFRGHLLQGRRRPSEHETIATGRGRNVKTFVSVLASVIFLLVCAIPGPRRSTFSQGIT